MQDRVSLYPGRVKLTPVSGQENTYDMVRADEPTQEGTPLSKATFLKDATASLFGLDKNAVPDDALLLLSRFQNGMGNEHIWSKNTMEYRCEVGSSSSTTIWGNELSMWIFGTGVTCNPETGEDIQVTGIFTPEQSPSNANSAYWRGLVTAGLYGEYNNSGEIFKFADLNGGAGTNYVSGHVGKIATRLGVVSTTYVNSPDPTSYPPSVDDGYTYEYMGQLGNKAQIATGSYTGTGTYGESNPNSLTFEFEPQFIFIQCMGDNEIGCFYPSAMSNAYVTGAGIVVDGNSNYTLYTKMAGTTLSWYGTNNQEGQLNRNKAYRYLAIG